MTRIGILVVLVGTGLSGCGVGDTVQPGLTEDTLGATSQAINARGWDYVTNGIDTNWQIKNATGPCAKADGAVTTTATCAKTDFQQNWVVFLKGDGRYEICRPNTLVNPVGKVAIMLNPNGPASYVVSQYWAAQCIYPTNFTDKPTDYRIGKVVLSYVLSGSSTFTSVPGAFRPNGSFVLDSWRWMTKNSGGVVVPAKYTGNADQQWSFISISSM